MAGFFYTRIRDRVKCFHCGLGLSLWSPYDDPWRNHSAWSPKCFYVKIMKGTGFEKLVKHEAEMIAVISDISDTPEPEPVDTKIVCKMCYLFPIDTIFLPCGHAAACTTCAKIINFTTRKCPLCRDTYQLYHEMILVG